MENLSRAACNPNDVAPLPLPNMSNEIQYLNEPLPHCKEFLSNLSPVALKILSKTISAALIIAKQKTQQKSRESQEGSAPSGSTTTSDILRIRCEHPGCNTTFHYNKDRRRHFRQKHIAGAKVEVFSCPVVDCPTGFGHECSRADKLRDHLRGEKISSYQWTYVFPGCSEVVSTGPGMIDRLVQHNFEERTSKLLLDYGSLVTGVNI
jgi:hypothetical protein